MDEWNIKFLLRIKVEGPKLKGFAEKMCANTDTLWWDSKNNVLTTTIKQNKNQKDSLTFILVNSWVGNKSSVDNDSDDWFG